MGEPKTCWQDSLNLFYFSLFAASAFIWIDLEVLQNGTKEMLQCEIIASQPTEQDQSTHIYLNRPKISQLGSHQHKHGTTSTEIAEADKWTEVRRK